MWISLSVDQTRALATPCFVYSRAVLAARVRRLRALDAKLLCAVKANPHPQVLATLQPLLDGADVASEGELRAARNAGFRQLSFAGPGKTHLERWVGDGVTVNVESQRELDALGALGVPVRARLRVNPATTFRAYRVAFTGGPRVFGIDEEQLGALRIPSNVNVVGVHLHPGAQCTSVAGVLEVARVGFDLLERVGGDELNLGGGFGAISPELELDVEALAPKLHAMKAKFPRPVTLFFEPGRWLMGPAGLYVTRVVNVKDSRGTKFVVLDGGIHHFLAASEVMLPKNAARAPVLNLSRPDAPRVKCSLSGVLCTPLDSLGTDVDVPEPQVGDVLAFQGAGAYGPTFSPLAFLSHAPAPELLVD
jgi:diaminopimelate decarboxylase